MMTKNNKTLYKVLGMVLLVVGVSFMIIALVDFFQVIIKNQDLLPTETPYKANMFYPLLSAPFLFGGFLFIILGFGTKKVV